MHGIVKPVDKVFSILSAEWHGLADVVPSINQAVIQPLLFRILTGAININLDGINVAMGNHKALVADLRHRLGELVGTEWEAGLVPLHIPKKTYRPIENGELWHAMEKALRDVSATVSCVGTLEAGKKFFISAKLDGNSEFNVNGDKFLAHLNFVTSHDGTLGVRAYDSTVRIVCMNTLRWSLSAAGDVGFNVYHTAGAELAMANLGELVNSVLLGRAQFKNDMEYLASVSCTSEDARLIALGYLNSLSDDDSKTSKRSLNAAEEIALLFSRGAGNNGKTMYDLLNGATEYWSNGSGVGKKTTEAEKAYKANFGEAADHKSAFCNLLMAGSDAVAKIRERGVKAESVVVLNADTAL